VAPGRKQDPGELFDWSRLADAGIGLWPNSSTPAEGDAAAMLKRFGYEPDSAGVVAAFQRHFRPTKIDGVVDEETLARLSDLVAALP
jgi:N-acetylmuramoyl-L-alanine amidase